MDCKKRLKIGFEGLEILCCIGVFEEEKTRKQPLIVDLQVEIDCPQKDTLEETVDYTALAAHCQEYATRGYDLIESYVHDILEELFQKYPIKWAWIKVRKPQAIKEATAATVEMERWASH